MFISVSDTFTLLIAVDFYTFLLYLGNMWLCELLTKLNVVLQSGVTPESENLTLSSSGAIDQSSCTGTPLSSTITSPEGEHSFVYLH